MEIKINGKTVQTNLDSVFAVQEAFYQHIEPPVCIINGFQTAENLKIKEGDELFFIEKGEMPKQEELEAMLSARHTPSVHEKVKKGRVAIVGLGGLGSNVAMMLARTGVGHLHLIDFDVVEPSNLNRQQYRICHLGKYKTQAMKDELQQINPFISVEIDTIRVSKENIASLLEFDDIICEAVDSSEMKALLVNTIAERFPQKKIVCGSGMAGYESSNLIQTKKSIGNLYLCGDGVHEAKIGQGLMAPRAAICAGHQANMILRLLLGQKEV